MPNILIGIPCLFDGFRTKQAIESVAYKEGVTVLLIDNGAEESVSKVISEYCSFPNVIIHKFEQNIYVNPVWNHILEYFNSNEIYSHLIIMNSDLVLCNNWTDIISAALEQNDYSYLVNITQDKALLRLGNHHNLTMTEIQGGHAGVFILINREVAKVVYPIPKEIVIWFGDNWIYDITRSLGYKTIVISELYAYHFWSTSVQLVEGIGEMIEEDKRQWGSVVEPLLLTKING